MAHKLIKYIVGVIVLLGFTVGYAGNILSSEMEKLFNAVDTKETPASKAENEEYHQDLAKIKTMRKPLPPEINKESYRKDPKMFTKQFIAFRDKNDLTTYEKFADEILNKWATKNPEYYGWLVLELCEPLGSGNFSDMRAYDLSRKYALLALEKSKDIPVDLELELTGRVVTMTIGQGASQGQELEQIRRKTVEVRANAWNRLLNSIDRSWDPNDLPVLNVVPPRGGGIAGGDPKTIEDPVLRAEYEAAIEANRLKALKCCEQSKLRDWLKRYPRMMANHFISIYSAAPYNNDELVSYLKDSKLDEPTKKRIIDTVTENIKQNSKSIPTGK
jgi:hypothetical protein